MTVRISYLARYDYAKPVTFSPHVARIIPQTGVCTRLIRTALATNAMADIQYRRDEFGNEVAMCVYPATATARLQLTAEFDLEITPRNPFHFLLAPHAITLPLEYTPDEQRALAPALTPQPGELGFHLPFWKSAVAGCPTVETISSLTTAVFHNIAYERREGGPARSPHETVQLGSGACRDTSLLMAAQLRSIGLAARLVSGYLWEPFDATEEHTHRADGAMHAWVEVFLPGAGWVGLDGTNGIFCDHSFIPSAFGLAPGDITPMSGRYYGDELIDSKLTLALTISELIS